MRTLNTAMAVAVLLAWTLPVSAESYDTRIGKLEFQGDFATSYPTKKTVDLLYDEMAFHGATQAYLWATPLVSSANWKAMNEVAFGAKLGDIIVMDKFDERHGFLTANNDTFYAQFVADLGRHGPVVIEIPEGIKARGSALDMWQRPVTDMTKSGKYLFLPGGAKPPAGADGFQVFPTETSGLIVALRLFAKTDKEKLDLTKKILVYPFSEKDNPPKESSIIRRAKTPIQAQPRGMAYWSLLHQVINEQPVAERDRFIMAMLRRVGIEKGEIFQPDSKQIELLTQAALVGEAMAKAMMADRRVPSAFYRHGSHWEIVTIAATDQRAEHFDQLDERGSWFYEAVLNNKAMRSSKPGKTQVYLGAYRDADGNHLDGGGNYTVTIPPNPPGEAFWSVTVYDVNHRTLIDNYLKKPSVGSVQKFDKNSDGSITLYFGPDKPEKDTNWIPTIPGEAWFAYLRLYSPTKPFFDGSWVMPDIEKAKAK